MQVLSDVHLDARAGWQTIDPSLFASAERASTLALLGDVCAIDDERLELALAHACDCFERVLFVPGNHEYYSNASPPHTKATLDGKLAALETLYAPTLRVLNCAHADLGNGVRVLGCTLWSHIVDADDVYKRCLIERSVRDYSRIMVHANAGGGRSDCTVAHTNAWHRHDVEWLDSALTAAANDCSVSKVIVLTHHAPLVHNTSDPRLEHGRAHPCLNQAFRTDLSALIAKHKPAAWCFGHTHWPADFYFGPTRVLSSPLGYPGELTETLEPVLLTL